MDEHPAHLRNSDAYQSLLSEMRVASALRRLGWTTVHSASYADAAEPPKVRELDVAATRSWIRARKTDEVYVRLHLLIECKGLRDKDLLFARHAAPSSMDHLYHHWAGLDDDALRERLRELLAEAGYAAEDVRVAMERFEAAMYPNGKAAVFNLLASAPRAPFRAAAERQAGRDAGTDPLWQATSSVFSALAGTTRELLIETLTELHDDLRFREHPVDDTIDYAVGRLKSAAATLSLFHPIVVTDATLHGVAANGSTTEISWCRLEQERIASRERRWIDVVNAGAFDDYASALSDWYGSRFERAGCTVAEISAE